VDLHPFAGRDHQKYIISLGWVETNSPKKYLYSWYTSWKEGWASQQVFKLQLPDIPWHLHLVHRLCRIIYDSKNRRIK